MVGLLVSSVLLAVAGAFNVDVEHPILFSDPTTQLESYFGFTVSLLKDPGFNADAWLVIGAPKANSSHYAHSTINEPGVVYLCKLERNSECLPLTLDDTGNARVSGATHDYSYTDKKDHAWIGGALAVQGSGNGRFVACGPRWKNQYYQGHYLMNGVCYWLPGPKNIHQNAGKLLPLVRRDRQAYSIDPDRNHPGVYYYAYGGAGISVDFVKNSTEMIIGAPGVFDWMGTVILYRDSHHGNNLPFSAPYFDVFTPNPYKTKSLPPSGYFGYSVGSGRFFRTKKMNYVGSAPRAGVFKGKVFIFDFPLQEEQSLVIRIELIGTQMGEYFGYSICVVDLNNDGLDDLVVGAPQYSLEQSGTKTQTGDEGRAYVFINEDNGRMLEISNSVKIMGSQHHGARFGTAISNIGDINNDGFPDIAVGAPYEEDGSGAIYIYHGKHNGLNSKYSQRISAQQIDSAIKGFGISISKGLDIDSNHYNDIAVGAYESGHGVLLRSRPIITFHSTLDSDVKKINFNATGFKTRACLLYTGVYAPPNIDVLITLQVDTYYRRSNFVTAFGRNNTIQFKETLTHVAESCTELQVEILSINQDFTKPILIRMDYSVIDSSTKNLDHPNNHRERKKRDVDSSFCKSCPIVDPLHPTYETLKIPYATGCGADDVCRTNLKTEVALMNIETPFILGTAPYILMKVDISNTGDPAFLTGTRIMFPRVVPLLRVPQNCQEKPINDSSSFSILLCEVGNPLLNNETRYIFLEFDATSIPLDMEALNYTFETESVGEKMSEEDGRADIFIPLATVADISIIGRSSQRNFYLQKQNKSEVDKIYSFSHVYEVTNYGPSPVDQIKFTFKFPTQIVTEDGCMTFLRVYSPEAHLGSQSFQCTAEGVPFYTGPTEKEQGSSLGHDIPCSTQDSSQKSHDLSDKNNTIKHDNILSSAMVPLNRTFFLNCSDNSDGCMTVTCITGPFISPQTRATLIFPIKVNSKYFYSVFEEKDIIVVTSTGGIHILGLPDSAQPENHRPDLTEAYTIFLGQISESQVDTWIIALAIAGGILILFLLIMALVKVGFFKRGKKEELEALKNKAELENTFTEYE